jgi:TPP-dependent pyruvate/acetoin dehydrogenase alpha subunit
LSLTELRKEITSKGGVTEAAIKEFKQDLPAAISTAFTAAMKRSDELSGTNHSFFATKTESAKQNHDQVFAEQLNSLTA